MGEDADWTFMGFDERVEEWEKNEPASAALDDVRLAVLAWIMNRHADPYQGARREDGFDNLWFAVIPGTYHDGQMVCCTYFIEERDRTLRCAIVQTLSLPI